MPISAKTMNLLAKSEFFDYKLFQDPPRAQEKNKKLKKLVFLVPLVFAILHFSPLSGARAGKYKIEKKKSIKKSISIARKKIKNTKTKNISRINKS